MQYVLGSGVDFYNMTIKVYVEKGPKLSNLLSMRFCGMQPMFESGREFVDPRKYDYLDKALYMYARQHNCSYDDAIRQVDGIRGNLIEIIEMIH